MSDGDETKKLAPKPESVEAISQMREVKGLDNKIAFLKKLDDEYFGFSLEKTGLLDVLDKVPEGFSFLETYYSSDAAIKNREFSDAQTQRYTDLRSAAAERDDHVLNKMMFKGTEEIRGFIIQNIDDIIGGKD